MPLAPGTSLGPYEIVAPLGAGGMGEVYRARDSRLDREVAVKVLPQHLSGNPELKQRFEREARTASSLNHPAICTVFDVGSQEGIDFLVMELLDGETLASALERGPVPVDRALLYARQLADGLDKAHRRGLIHRDLKPGNIMITKEGAKLMDFGLAKAAGGPAGADSPMTAAATLSSPLTAEGTMVGTFQYMAPEQLEGGEATSRSDIYAFGTVLYEMLTGQRPFQGKTQAALAASILKETPRPLTALQPMTPPALERLVATCMEKDPDERRQTMHDVLLELRWIAEGGSQAGLPAPTVSRRRSRERTAWMVAGVMAVAAAASLALLLLPGRGAPAGISGAPIHVAIPPPEGQRFDLRRGPMALSPDGSRIVFVARDPEGESHLWVRELDRPEPRRLEGTAGALYPFWSPDSRFIAYFAEMKLMRIGRDGGPPDTICPVGGIGAGGSWSPGGTIIFSSGAYTAISKVPATGGTPEPLTGSELGAGEFTHRFPTFLPDGRRFLFNIRSGKLEGNTVAMGSIDGDPVRTLISLDSNVTWSPTGHLVFWRDGALRAQEFDLESLELRGVPVPVAPEARFQPDLGYASYSISGTGLLAYDRGGLPVAHTRLMLFDRRGGEKGSVGPPGNYYAPRFSHDGRKVAVDNSGIENNGDIWVYEIGRPGGQRLTSDSADQSMPIWSPDDNLLALFSAAGGSDDLYTIDMTRQARPELLLDVEKVILPLDWTPDGRKILLGLSAPGAGSQSDLALLDLQESTLSEWRATDDNESLGAFSPDGRWLAYTSDQSGRNEIYLEPFPGPGPRTQISTDGGSAPVWRGDGKEILYIAPDEFLMSVALDTSGGSGAAPPVRLFRTEIRNTDWRHFDVSPDGQTILVNTLMETATSEPVALVLNWPAMLDRD